MAYIVTGYEPFGNGRYYFLNTDTGKICTAMVDDIKKIPSHSFNIQNMKIKSNLEYGNILTSSKNTCKNAHSTNWELIRGGGVLSGSKTLVILDFNKNTFGVIGSLDKELTWYDLGILESIHNIDVYNNVMINRETCELELENYFIIGNKRKIILNKVLELKEQNKPQKNVSKSKTVHKNKDKQEEEQTTYRVEDNNIECESNNEEEPLELNTYIKVLRSLHDNDTITLSRGIFKELKFSLIVNVDKTLLLDKRISVGKIKLGNNNVDTVIVIVRYDDNSEYVTLQMFKSLKPDGSKSYSIEKLQREYSVWRQRNKYLSI